VSELVRSLLRGVRRGAAKVAATTVIVTGVIAGAVFVAQGSTTSPVPRMADPALRSDPPEVTVARADVDAFAGAVPVLTYHDVSDTADSRFAVTPRRFAEHMAALDAAGFRTVTLDQVHDLATGGEVDLPARPVLITFDDGAVTNWTEADPVLAGHGFTAVAFVVTGNIPEQPPSYYASWGELAAMHDSGRWDIQAHTHQGHREIDVNDGTGPWLTHLATRADGTNETLPQWRARVRRDFTVHREVLADRLGVDVDTLAYPFSAARFPTNDDRIPGEVNRLVSEQFRMAFTGVGQPKSVQAGDDLILLPRLASITSDMTATDILERIEQAVPRPPGGLDDYDWASDTGRCTVAGDRVEVTGDSYMMCAPKLTGTDAGWVDYTVDVEVTGTSRAATAVVAVRAGAAGRAEIAIGEGSFVVRQQAGGTWEELGRFDLIPAPARRLAVTVSDSELIVAVDGGETEAFVLDDQLAAGTIGFGLAPQGEQTISFAGSGAQPFAKP
jgi:poly-beta-1,6-N-acetyl-D-glucosamine N-deacetylase